MITIAHHLPQVNILKCESFGEVWDISEFCVETHRSDRHKDESQCDCSQRVSQCPVSAWIPFGRRRRRISHLLVCKIRLIVKSWRICMTRHVRVPWKLKFREKGSQGKSLIFIMRSDMSLITSPGFTWDSTYVTRKGIRLNMKTLNMSLNVLLLPRTLMATDTTIVGLVFTLNTHFTDVGL